MPKMPFDPAKDIAPHHLWWCACRKCSPSAPSSASATSRASSPQPRPIPARSPAARPAPAASPISPSSCSSARPAPTCCTCPIAARRRPPTICWPARSTRCCSTSRSLLPHVRSGAVKVLAVTSDTRPPLLPDVPTMRELGFPKVNSDNWYALVSPGASSPQARKKISRRSRARAQDQGAGPGLCQCRRRGGRRHVGRARALPRRGRRQVGRRHQGAPTSSWSSAWPGPSNAAWRRPSPAISIGEPAAKAPSSW